MGEVKIGASRVLRVAKQHLDIMAKVFERLMKHRIFLHPQKWVGAGGVSTAKLFWFVNIGKESMRSRREGKSVTPRHRGIQLHCICILVQKRTRLHVFRAVYTE